jgi:hypothetical protein
MTHMHQVELQLLPSGSWTLWGDGVLLAGMTGQHGLEAARDWASDVLETTHGVGVDHWPGPDGPSHVTALISHDRADACDLFTFKAALLH